MFNLCGHIQYYYGAWGQLREIILDSFPPTNNSLPNSNKSLFGVLPENFYSFQTFKNSFWNSLLISKLLQKHSNMADHQRILDQIRSRNTWRVQLLQPNQFRNYNLSGNGIWKQENPFLITHTHVRHYPVCII